MKEAAYQFCETYSVERLSRIQKQIEEISRALHAETKSTAGDKHETGRAMLQLEREKLGQQLLAAEKMQQLVYKAQRTKPTNTIILGSLVKTTQATYYIAISAGSFVHKGVTIYCISANTPIGKLLLGKSNADSFVFNNTTHKIVAVS